MWRIKVVAIMCSNDKLNLELKLVLNRVQMLCSNAIVCMDGVVEI